MKNALFFMLLLFLSTDHTLASNIEPDASVNKQKEEMIKKKKSYDFDSMFSKKKTKPTTSSSNKIDVSQFKKNSEEEYSNVETDYYYKHEYVPPERVDSVVSGSCYAINNDDLKNDCIANTKNDDDWCFSINDKNLMNSCLGQLKIDSSYCFSINDNDMKNACLASTKQDSSYCFSANNEDIKNSFLAQTKYERDWCFSINNTNIKNACLAIVN
jgi:hypothetical protein